MQATRMTRAVMAAAAILWLGGCMAPGAERIGQMRSSYAQGDYPQTYRLATSVADGAAGHTGEEAAYMAGMSAYKMGRLPDAQRYLSQAAESSDEPMSGDALATQGLIYARQGQHASAARVFLKAAPKLTGQSRANAYYYAAVSEQALGRPSDARNHLTIAGAASADADFQRQVNDRIAVTGYCLQVGAFTKEINARHAMDELAREVNSQQIGPPRVVSTIESGGRQLYLVQVGRFANYSTAQTARNRLKNASSVIIVPLGK